MMKSLGDYNKKKSSSTDVNNITWTQKNPTDPDKSRNKNRKKISPLNIIPSINNTKTSKILERVYKIELVSNINKLKTEKYDRRFENSSASNCLIGPGFKRPAR
ncbi:MAG: hypothetical protein HQ505_08860 [Nitrosopumilus sp.]|nr:hypothetical protein [Nitrosopumilus sp.]